MPLNKEAYIRYRIIDECLRNKQKPFPNMYDLMDAMHRKLDKEISESTIQKDIKAMKEDEALSYRAPIVFDRRYKGYAYSDPNYSINDFPLTQSDLQSLEFAATILKQFKGIELLDEFNGAVQKIFEAIQISTALSLEDRTDFIELEKQPQYKGSEWLKTIIRAIQERQMIRFIHRSYEKQEGKGRELAPYLLKQYHQRWYVIGMEGEIVKTFGLDRISALEILDEKYKLSTTFDAQHYFRHTFGITSFSGKAEKIELSFHPLAGQYIKSVPLHKTQKILRENANEVIVELEVGITIELVQAILKYGSAAKVLKPAALAEQLKTELQKSLQQYQ